MNFSHSVFTIGHLNPLANFGLRHGLGFAQLWMPVVVLALALAYAAYTDLFCGRVIRNSLNAALAMGGLAVTSLLFKDPGTHLIEAAVVIAIVFVMFMTRAMAEGDLKLFAALALILGKAAGLLLFLSIFLMVAYSIPTMYTTVRRNRASGHKAKRGERLGMAPGGPGIALAFPLLLVFAGVKPLYCLALAGIEVVAVGLYLGMARFNEKALAAEAEKAAAAGEA